MSQGAHPGRGDGQRLRSLTRIIAGDERPQRILATLEELEVEWAQRATLAIE
jgi:hypothetical protein